MAGNDVTRLFEDWRGDIWIATFVPGREVLTRWERATDRFHRYSDREGLPALNAVTAFCEDSSGNLWIGFRNSGVARYREGRFKMFTARDGLPEGDVPALHLDRAGRLWISASSEHGGLCRVDDPSAERPNFKVYTTRDGLASNNVRRLTEDLEGRIYADTIKGIDRLDPNTGRIKHYTIADGLSAETLYSAFGDRQGHVWFGTFHGLSRITPGPERPTTPPPVFISRLRIAGVAHPLSVFGESKVAGPELDSNRNQIQIDYFGLSFAAGRSLSYRYKVEGLDSEWSAPISQRTINLSLSPGTYRFLVEAIASDGTRSPAPAEIAFTILSPVWQRWWFIALASIVTGLLVYIFYRYRVARLLELERVRTRIATDLHDDIGASLSQVAVITEVLRRQLQPSDPRIAQNLSLMARVSREVVDSMSDIVWAINPQKDYLHDLARHCRRFAGETLAPRDIEIRFHALESEHYVKLGADVRRQVFLIFKETINNILRHAHCTEVGIDLTIDGSRLVLRVSDNGKGMSPDQTSDGHGLASMKLRAERLGGSLEIDSSAGRGTIVTLRIPHRPHLWSGVSGLR